MSDIRLTDRGSKAPLGQSNGRQQAYQVTMEAELRHNLILLPNCANHAVIGATRLPLGPICANHAVIGATRLPLGPICTNQSFTSQAVPIQFRNWPSSANQIFSFANDV